MCFWISSDRSFFRHTFRVPPCRVSVSELLQSARRPRDVISFLKVWLTVFRFQFPKCIFPVFLNTHINHHISLLWDQCNWMKLNWTQCTKWPSQANWKTTTFQDQVRFPDSVHKHTRPLKFFLAVTRQLNRWPCHWLTDWLTNSGLY